MSSAEDLLIKRSRDGNISAFEELVTPYQQKIYNTAYRLLGNYHDASDITQEVLLKIYKSLAGFRGDSSFSTWVYSITTNACRDEMVKRKKYTQFSIDEILVTEKGEISKEIVDETVCLENEYISKESVQHIHQLILSLSEDYRLVIVLRDQLGLSYQEIADRLDISLGTVKSRINRARKLLQTKILEDGELYPEINRLLNARRGK